MTWRRAAAAMLTVVTFGLGGCAALKDFGQRDTAAAARQQTGEAGPAEAAADAVASTAPPSPPNPALDVQAPPALKRLLERYLDIARVGTFAGTGDDAIDDAEWSRLIDAVPLQARELLQTEGYYDPQVTVANEPATVEGGARRVVVTVEPGPRTRVGRVTIELEGDLERAAEAGDPLARETVDAFRRDWQLGAGRAFRNASWSDAKAAALQRLRAAGYALAGWTGTGAEVDSAQHSARLFVVADSGPLFRYGELQIEGLVAQDSGTVRNLAGFAPGVPVTDALLLDYQERLQKSGLFDNVTVTLDPDPDNAAKAKVQVRLKEAPLQVYTFGLGYSANTGPRASVEHVWRRVFGQALTARNKFEVGGLRQAWDGELSTHPGERYWRNFVGGTVERLESDDDVVLSQRVRVGRGQDTQRMDRQYYLEAERSERTPKDVDPRITTDVKALSLNQRTVWRNLDNLILPTEGYTLSLQTGAGHAWSNNADSGPFARLYGRLTGYLPLGGKWYGQGRVELGQVVKRDAVAVPDSQLFRAGGDESVRGYRYRSLGPIVDGAVAGGTTLVTTSVEIARPVSSALPSVWGAVFVDAGNASNNFDDRHLAVGTGVGVRWRSPVGPLRLDVAYGVDAKKVRLHFSVGIGF